MARRLIVPDSSEDELPDLETLGRQPRRKPSLKTSQPPEGKDAAKSTVPVNATRRRRKLGQASDNLLLKRWDGRVERDAAGVSTQRKAETKADQRTTRNRRPSVNNLSPENPEDKSVNVGVVIDDSSDGASEFFSFQSSPRIIQGQGSGNYGNDNKEPTLRPTPRCEETKGRPTERTRGGRVSSDPSVGGSLSGISSDDRQALPDHGHLGLTFPSPPRTRRPRSYGQTKIDRPAAPASRNDLARSFAELWLSEDSESPSGRDHKPSGMHRPRTPEAVTPSRRSGLKSPKKLPRLPMTPHRPSMDTFWDQEFVDEWNNEHSPAKLVKPPIIMHRAKKSPVKDCQVPRAALREAKKTFEKEKRGMASSFLRELDEAITGGKIHLLAASTGGVQILWTNKLNTTAGRANWRKETTRTKGPDGAEPTVTYRHHASIELAEKVIDDEARLLNVIAHEFCHLANFMVSEVTGNPHGKEFKAWAAKCSRVFGHRGIEVTTKHTYEIDFKYIWECTACGAEFKRHSKSIDPSRHRCGSCKSELKQIKPVPRVQGEPSEYQKFMREQMKVIKQENPESPQKAIMKLVAEKWAKKGTGQSNGPGGGVSAHSTGSSQGNVDDVASVLTQLTISDHS